MPWALLETFPSWPGSGSAAHPSPHLTLPSLPLPGRVTAAFAVLPPARRGRQGKSPFFFLMSNSCTQAPVKTPSPKSFFLRKRKSSSRKQEAMARLSRRKSKQGCRFPCHFLEGWLKNSALSVLRPQKRSGALSWLCQKCRAIPVAILSLFENRVTFPAALTWLQPPGSLCLGLESIYCVPEPLRMYWTGSGRTEPNKCFFFFKLQT